MSKLNFHYALLCMCNPHWNSEAELCLVYTAQGGCKLRHSNALQSCLSDSCDGRVYSLAEALSWSRLAPASRVKYRLYPACMKKPRLCNDAIKESAKSFYSQSLTVRSWLYTPCILHLAVNFEDGFYVGEVLVFIMDVETVKNSYMVLKKISTATNH